MKYGRILMAGLASIGTAVMLRQASVPAFAQSPVAAQAAGSAHYRVIDLGRVDPWPPGEPNFIANTGLVAGAAPVTGGAVHAVVWFGGMSPIDIGAARLGGPNSEAFGMNNRGQVVGAGQTSDANN